jgi:hypothetical protein
MRAFGLVFVLAAALAACRSPAPPEPGAGFLRGKVTGVQSFPATARVQVYRVDPQGIPTPDPFELAPVDKVGRFRTHDLLPGNYRLVYRGAEGPPAVCTTRVPTELDVVLRPLVTDGLVQLRLGLNATFTEPVRCRLTEAEPPGGDIPDVRDVRCAPFSPLFVRGMRPGRWYVDLPELGATTEIVLPETDVLRELDLDPPLIESGAILSGEVRRTDGDGAAWVIVAVRPLPEPGASATAWGRFAVTDRAGRFQVIGIPPGPSLVRVECREVRYRIPGSAEFVTIPPSGRVSRGFVVEP